MKAKFLPLLLLAILLQVSMFSFANEMTSARRIRLKNKTEVQHRSIPVTPDACIENSLLSIDLLSTVPTVTVIIKNAETDEVVYTSTDLNVDKVMRTAYGATSPRVGVFRVGSCGNYKYLSIKIDCENGNSKTSVSGNVGDTYVDGGDNMRLEFCMVDAGFRYPGGVFLFEDVPLETMTLVRYHDTEDGGHNGVWSDDPNYYDVMHISGMSKLDSNATLAWNINRNMTKWGDIPVGPAGINYGVIAPAEMASGNLYFDDEDHNNKNWAQVWLGPQNQYEPHGTYYGVQLDRNTRYHVCLNTDKTNFTKLVRSAI